MGTVSAHFYIMKMWRQNMSVPKHVAIILDGNGRWAKKKGMPRSYGHTVGAKNVETICEAADDLGVKYLTLYAFSTENWKRPKTEVNFLMNLFYESLKKELQELHEDNVQIHFIGRIDGLPESLQKQMHEAEELMKNNTGVKFNVAVNYGGQDELVRAVKKIAADVQTGKISPDAIDEKLVEDSLDTCGNLPVDLVIRTSGDMRLSNFLLWQAAYAEFYFTDVNWPDFSPECFVDAMKAFANRDRRFGGLNDNKK
jgi:undecaprenyl diphosphate synthase